MLSQACRLRGTFQAGERTRSWFVTVGDYQCSTSSPRPDDIPLHVRIENQDRERIVTLEASAEDVPDETLRQAVATTAGALRDMRNPPPPPPQPRPPPPAQSNGHAQGTAIAVAAVAGGVTVTIVVVVVVGVVVAVGALFVGLITAFSKL